MNKARALFIINKALPDTDYRLDYGSRSSVCDVVYALPERTKILPVGKYVHLGFEEGIHLGVIKALWDLFVYLRRHRRSLAFVHFYTTNPILFGPIVSHLAGVNSVITFTGFGRVMTSTDRRYLLLRPIYRLLLNNAFKTARLVLFQNKSDLKRFQTEFPAFAEKYHFVGSTTSTGVIAQKDFDAEKLTVLLATRLMPEKGVADFIDVAKTLFGTNFRFLLAGPPSRGHAELHRKVLSAAKAGLIEYSGNLRSPEMERALEESHILFFPSSYGEGLARLMLEAGFARLCPIAYNIPANRDLVAEGRGFLVETGDLQRIIQILLSLDADRELPRRNAAAYQAFILRHYGRAQFAQRLDRLFQDMLDKSVSFEGSVNGPN